LKEVFECFIVNVVEADRWKTLRIDTFERVPFHKPWLILSRQWNRTEIFLLRWYCTARLQDFTSPSTTYFLESSPGLGSAHLITFLV